MLTITTFGIAARHKTAPAAADEEEEQNLGPSLSEGVPTAVSGDLMIANSSQKCLRMRRKLFECELTSFASPETRVRLHFSQP